MPLREAAGIVLRECLNVQPGETVLVVDDHVDGTIGRALFGVAREMGAEAMRLEMLPRSRNGEEPPAPVAAAMRAARVVVAPTSRSLTHTRARREACEAGARVATLPGVTETMLVRTMSADYQAVRRRSDHVAEVLSRGQRAYLINDLGTELTLSLAGRDGIPDTGHLETPGAYGNLPAGEGFIAPVEGTAEGVLVVDACIAGIGVLNDPLSLEIHAGRVTEIRGGEEARRLEEMFDPVGPDARVLCELGVGTNEKAIITGVVLEDEKVLGTVHIAFGNNLHFGGINDVPFHIDGVITTPTLTVDDTVLIERGVPRF
jgi:leucyl aminopeptidase (aminopeptidase T)